MKKEFEMTQQEWDSIMEINKEGGDSIMYLSGGVPMGRSLQEKINDYWKTLGKKYNFISDTVEQGNHGHLSFLAEPLDT